MKKFLALAFLLFAFPAIAADRSFGDSITDGTGADSPQTTNGYIPKLAALLGTTITNLAHGGDMQPDQTNEVYSVNVAAGDRSVIMLGVNDQRIYGVNSTKRGYFRDGMRNHIAWLALGTKKKARDVAGETGSWDNTQLYGIGRHTTANGATKSFTNTGTVAYLSMLVHDNGGGCLYNLKKNGTLIGSYDGNTTGSNTYLGYPYTERLHRITGVVNGDVIAFEKTGGPHCYVEWFADNNQTIKPKVYVGNVIKAAPSYSWGGSLANVQAYNTDIAQLVSELGSDGLDVTLVDAYSALNDSTDLHPADGLHPSQAGHDKLAQVFYNAMATVPPPTCPPGQTGTPPNCVTPPPTLTFQTVPVYRRLNNGTPDGTFWIDDGTSRKQIQVQ